MLQVESLPLDWPGSGPIDLDIHDLPHATSTLEWWYANCHMTAEDGRDFSLFASFFRTAVDQDPVTREYVYAHALTWALVDPQGKRYIAESLVDKDAPAIVKARLERGEVAADPLGKRAMLEMVDKGRIPHPDVLLTTAGFVGRDRLELDYDGRRFEKLEAGRYALTLAHDEEPMGCALTFTMQKPVVRHGDDGVVQGKSSEQMFYYFTPRCRVEGAITVDGQVLRVVQGSGWYDHEFGCGSASESEGDTAEQGDGDAAGQNMSWDWLSAQLDNGCELSVYHLFDDAGDAPQGRFAVVIDAEGRVRRYDDFTFEGAAPWTSSKTFVRYPTVWALEIPAAGVTLQVEASVAAQEVIAVIAPPSFWEGRVSVAGVMDGVRVQGLGFVERTGFDAPETIPDFLRSVGRETRRSVQALLPHELDARDAARLVGSERRPRYLDGVDFAQLSRVMVAPIRSVVDRGGKAWRSYAAVACCDAVGGDSQPLIEWLALPELLHVGSLLVDDVQDRSEVRRGGPAAHHIYGEALAINAGSSCYFLPKLFLDKVDLPDADKLRIYDLYFTVMRAAHAGQALDIDGFGHNMPRVVERGEGAWAERHVRAVHRLKSGVPAGCLGQVGAILGRGSDAQVEALGRFLEDLGLAFQIVDDVLNLRGFDGDIKERGEDIAHGKVTMPVAKAMSLLPREGRERLWDIIASKPADRSAIDRAIAIIEGCGALDACRADAERLVEEGWARLDPLLRDSHVKLKLRAFSWYVLDRHY